MRHHPAGRVALAVATAATLAVSPASLLASGFQLVEQNGSGLGNAYAGQAAGAEDASAIYFNPSGLTRVPGKQFVLAVSGIGISNKFTDTGSGKPFFPGLPFPVATGGAGGDA